MSSPIENLVDDCFFHIFDFLDPLALVTVSQVCTRWERLAQRPLKKVTEINLNDPQFCCADHQKISKTCTNAEALNVSLHYFGEHLKTVQLGTCRTEVIFINRHYGYIINDGFDLPEFISTLCQTCTNIEYLQITNPNIVTKKLAKQLFESNKKLKKVTLPDRNLFYPNCRFKSVEEVVLKVSGKSRFENFELLFPNLKKLTLNARPPSNKTEIAISSILQRVKKVKSLTIVSFNKYLPEYFLKLLSDISALTQLEELKVWQHGWFDETAEFEVDSVKKMIQKCQNLRVVKFYKIALGKTTVSSLLNLPKLEQLFVMNVQSFGPKISNNIENLTRLHIALDQNKKWNFLSMIEAVGRMPALEYLIVSGFPEKEMVDFSCKVISNRVLDKDIIIIPDANSPFRPFRICNDVDEPRPGPLKLWISPQKNDYGARIYKFALSLKKFSIVSDDNVGDLFETSFNEYGGFFDVCSCSHTYYY